MPGVAVFVLAPCEALFCDSSLQPAIDDDGGTRLMAVVDSEYDHLRVLR